MKTTSLTATILFSLAPMLPTGNMHYFDSDVYRPSGTTKKPKIVRRSVQHLPEFRVNTPKIILQAVADGANTHHAVFQKTGINKATISILVRKMVADGKLEIVPETWPRQYECVERG